MVEAKELEGLLCSADELLHEAQLVPQARHAICGE
jgi:hypothetical protein